MSWQHYIVIGNGPAGNQAAFTLREKAPEARITIISGNVGGSFRPHLLPDFIAGKIPEESLFVVTPDRYKEKEITFRHGQRVVKLDPNEKTVILDHKEVISFDGLIIAVGGKPRIPEHLHSFEGLMLTLKTVEDAHVWISRLAGVDSILLIGGDLTSLAVTKALLHLQKKVYLMLTEHAFWPLRPDEALFAEVSDRLACRGVEVLGGEIRKIVPSPPGDSFTVQFNHRPDLQVGLVGAFYGLSPEIDFLRRSGFRMDRGILVDEYLNTGFEGVYATGDCAQIYHPGLRNYWVSIGHANAVTLGKVAANNLLGGKSQVTVPTESVFELEEINVNTSWWMEF
jgi:NAD(P)H-nitrite reductase large subunit